MRRVRFVTGESGAPGVIAEDVLAAMYGMGVLHARHRPVQAMLLHLVGRGSLASTIAPREDIVALDAVAHRLDVVRRGTAAARLLTEEAGRRVDAYLDGFSEEYMRRRPFEFRVLGVDCPPPDRGSLLSGFLISAYLGLAEGQERMERLLVDALHEGADADFLEHLFRPHLDGWAPDALRSLSRDRPPLGFAAHSLGTTGGSNAWAVDRSRSISGSAMLAGDPHLVISQLPSLFFEMGVRLPDDYWIGATIPGLPGVAVGRNRHVAWSGTFGVADNVDGFVEPKGTSHEVRSATIERRFMSPVELEFNETPRGTLDGDPSKGPVQSIQWSGREHPHEAIDAYFKLLEAKTVGEAERALLGAHTLSLHFVLADRAGDIRYVQVGRIPRRTGGWSGMYPSHDPQRLAWDGRYAGTTLPRGNGRDGIVATANEARVAADGGVLSTFGLAPYRLRRIHELLAGRRRHGVESMRRIQTDLYSIQAKLLRPKLLAVLDDCPLARVMAKWDLEYRADSVGAHAFEIVYRAALAGLSARLGGVWFERTLGYSEARVWWSHALDRALLDDRIWVSSVGQDVASRLAELTHVVPRPWAEAQQLKLPHMLFGGLPKALGFDRGPYPLVGSSATICQGNLVRLGAAELAVGPAYRFITDLGEDAAYTSLPGGIDGSRFDSTYAVWLDDHLDGKLHRLVPPG